MKKKIIITQEKKNKSQSQNELHRDKSSKGLKHESDEKYKSILENMLEGYFEVDLAGNLTLFNDSMARLYGYSQKELTGMNYRQYTDPESAKNLFQVFNGIYKTGEPVKEAHWQAISKDGTRKYFEGSASLIKDPSGKATGFRGIIHDITERRIAEDLIRKSEFQYRLLADYTKDQIFLMDFNFQSLYVSPSVKKLLGYTMEELNTFPWDKLLTAETLEKVLNLLSNLPPINMDSSDDILDRSVEIELISKDGRKIWEEIRCSFIRDKNGKAVSILGQGRDITDRKHAEKALQESEAKYRLLADNMTENVWLMDLNMMRTIYLSPSAVKMHGYTADEYKKMSLKKVLTPESFQKMVDAFMIEMPKAMATPPPDVHKYSLEVQARHKDGHLMWIENTVSFLRDKSGNITLLLGESRDVNQRKLAEEMSKKSEEQYRLLADHMKDQVWLMDLDLKVSYISPSVEKLLGHTFAELKELLLNKLLTPESFQRAMDFFSKEMPKALAAPSDYVLDRSLDLEFCCKDGRTVSGEIKFSFIRDESGKPVFILGEGRDITERLQMEKVLKKSEERYRSVFENAGLPLLIMEDSLLIFMVNDRFVEMTGYEKNEIEGQMKFTDFIRSEDRDDIIKCFSPREGDQPVEYESLITHCNGEKFDVLIRIGCIPDAGQFIASFTDITARKQAETVLLENSENLQKENIRLRSSIRDRYRFCDIIGKSRKMQEVYEFILQAADTQANVIIYGESGTGKELVAKAIHGISDRSKKGFVIIHCGAIPETLMESEFFGYKKGAFTGANMDRHGYMDEADGGTLFLDEIGEIGLNMQVKLLRAISGDGYTPVGSNSIYNPDIRIIAATNRNLRNMVKRGAIREDFFYRIHILPIYLPPLRERKEDLPLLIDHFLDLYDSNHPPLPGYIAESLLNYDWPGNIRELQNVLHRFVTLKKLDFADMPIERPASRKNGLWRDDDLFNKVTAVDTVINSHDEMEPDNRHIKKEKLPVALTTFERDHIVKALAENKWRRSQTAAALGISRRNLFRKMQKLGIAKS